MAPSNDAGEISAAVFVASAPADPDPDPPYLEPEMDDSRHTSASSSPPTRLAFSVPSPRVANAGQVGIPHPGKENVCPSPMAAAYSPLGSPLAVHLAGKKSPQRPAANAGAVLNKFIYDCTSRSPRAGPHRRGLGDIDTSNTEPQPENDVTPAADSNSSKKSKRKSKKTNGVKEKSKANSDDQPSSQPASYAEAAKEDPADVINGEHGKESNGQDPHQEINGGQAAADESGADASGPESKGAKEKNSDNQDAQPTVAGSLTFAEAVKESSTNVATTNGEAADHATTKSRSPEKRSVSATLSQGSTAVDYPDIPSDAEDRGEEAERLRDQEKAPEVAGLRWAPLRVPFKRRLQTLAVLFHCLCMGTTLSIFFGFCAIPLLWPLRKSFISELLGYCRALRAEVSQVP